jgi:hypothetical protein
MVDRVRTKSELLKLFADNKKREISAQDARDLIVTVFNHSENQNNPHNVQGIQGPQGNTGPKGDKGDPGDEVWTLDGDDACFSGTNADAGSGSSVGAMAQGSNVNASGTNGCFAQGNNTTASGDNGCLAFGNNATASAETSVQLGTGTNSLASSLKIKEFLLGVGELETNSTGAGLICFRSPSVNFKTVSDTAIYTVPSDYLFLLNTMEVLTTSISGAGTAPTIRFGYGGGSPDYDSYLSARVTTSNSEYSRHIFDKPKNAINSSTILTGGVTIASTATSHSGYFLITGFLVKS